MDDISEAIEALSHLRSNTGPAKWSDSTLFRAPHKPLLLLSVVDLFAEGQIQENLIEITPELGELFSLYWGQIMPPDRHGNLALPFFHLRSDGFWHLVPRPGNERLLPETGQISSLSRLRDLILGARLDESLFHVLQGEEARAVVRSLLIHRYFAPDVRPRLEHQALINAQAYQYGEQLLLSSHSKRVAESLAEAELYLPAARSQGFRRAVVGAYAHRCAFCGVRVLTADGHSAVDASHVVPWSITHNDDPRNGVALCRLCHWGFDEGVLGISTKYLVLTSPQIADRENVPGHLATLAGRGILGPGEENLWPDLDALKWHWRNTFRSR